MRKNHDTELSMGDPVAIIIMLAIGAVAGWLAGLIYGTGFGLIGNIIVGAIVAGFLLPGRPEA